MEQKQNAFHGNEGLYFAQSWVGIERIRERIRLGIQSFKLNILKTLPFMACLLSKISSIIFGSQVTPTNVRGYSLVKAVTLAQRLFCM